MTITSKTRNTVAGAVTLAVTVLGLGVAPTSADAYNTVDTNPTISCLAGFLELKGRVVTGSVDGEQVFSLFQIYVWTADGWRLDEQTAWKKLVLGRNQLSASDYTAVKRSGSYYAAREYIASWDGTKWRYDMAWSSLSARYVRSDGYFGSGYYARCS